VREGKTVTLQESVRRAILYSALAFVLTTVVVVGDAALAPAYTDNQATPTATAAPVFVQVPADFPTGVFVDHLGELVQVDASRITYYSRDVHGGAFFDINGRSYHRTPSGRLFRVED
jgi:uncharacterized phosphosugar-binding protein